MLEPFSDWCGRARYVSWVKAVSGMNKLPLNLQAPVTASL